MNLFIKIRVIRIVALAFGIERFHIHIEVGPRHRLAIAGIIGAPHSGFGAIVDHRSTDGRYLIKQNQSLDRAVLSFRFSRVVFWIVAGGDEAGFVVVEDSGVNVVFVAGVEYHGGEAVGVVGVHEVLHGVGDGGMVGITAVADHFGEFGGADGAVDEVAFDGDGEAVVVHGCGESAFDDEAGGVFPDFCDGVGLGVDFADVGVPVFPEADGEFVGDVESPAVDAVGGIAVAVGVHPALGDLEDVVFGIGVHVEAVGSVAEDGEGAEAPPAFVAEFVAFGAGIIEFVDLIPIAVGRVLLIEFNVAKGEEVGAGVVEDAVDDDADVAFFGFLEEVEEEFVGAGPLPRGGVLVFFFDDCEIADGVRAKVGVDVVE